MSLKIADGLHRYSRQEIVVTVGWCQSMARRTRSPSGLKFSMLNMKAFALDSMQEKTLPREGQMPRETQTLNLSDLAVKRQLMSAISAMSGLYDVGLWPRKKTRSLSQNSYYFTAVVTPFRDWLRTEFGDPEIDSEQAHEMLKVRILGLDEKLVDDTGEVLMLIPRSKTLDTWEFTQYIEKCCEWLASFCGIVVLPAEMFYEPAQSKRSLKQDLGESILMARKQKRA
jgi:hypothetical protein